MTAFKFGALTLDAPEFASQGSAVLGIRDSGKTYTATALAERMYDAGVPFIAFDPIGVWRFLRVPGSHRGGRGYPIVVAGGVAGDLPLTPATAPAIVEAAMSEGVSLVIDLFHIDLSKADWRRIVRDSVRLLLHRNKPHGLRHVFLEEAAEFAPQKVLDGDVYAEIEKLARMGGNSRLGYTLINQRAEEVNKAVLELCDNLFLHRQKGRNSLTALTKWLDVGGVKEGKAVIESLATLPQGECWAWLAGADHAIRIKGPRKHSMHPDRRVMRGDDDAAPGKGAVDVGKFVKALNDALPKLAADAEANDPKKLQQQISKLQRELRAAQKHPAAAPQAGLSEAEIAEARRIAFIEGARSRDQEIQDAFAAGADAMLERLQQGAATARQKLSPPKPKPVSAPVPVRALSPPPRVSTRPPPQPPRGAPKAAVDIGELSDKENVLRGKVLEALAFWEASGITSPTRVQVGFVAGYDARAGVFRKVLNAMREACEINYEGDAISFTPGGAALAPEVGGGSVWERLSPKLSDLQRRIVESLPYDGGEVSREFIGTAIGMSPQAGVFRGALNDLRSMQIIRYDKGGAVSVEPWVWS